MGYLDRDLCLIQILKLLQTKTFFYMALEFHDVYVNEQLKIYSCELGSLIAMWNHLLVIGMAIELLVLGWKYMVQWYDLPTYDYLSL